jgi:YbgC/YbaW family acyl-CoA thioester hydrolase
MTSSSKPIAREHSASAFHVRERIRLADTDAMGIIHFGSYARLIEIVEIEFFRSLGLTLPGLAADSIVMPRVHVSYDFFRPALLDDEVILALTVAGVGVHSVRYAIDIVRASDDVTLAEATVVSACMDRATRKSVALPESIAQTLRALVPAPPEA